MPITRDHLSDSEISLDGSIRRVDSICSCRDGSVNYTNTFTANSRFLEQYRKICEHQQGKRQVYFSFHFIKFGEIDTKNQCFTAEVLIVARWYEPYLKNFVRNDGFEIYKGPLWDPRLVLINLETILAGVNQINETIRIDQKGQPYIQYTRRIRGVFFEKMELWEFPRDIQDLSIVVMSELNAEEIDLLEDITTESTLKPEMFQDENNFSIYDVVQISPKLIPDPTKRTTFSMPIISATCRVERNPMFYIWNNYLIMTCLAFISITTFSIDPKQVKYRLTVILTILLTSVTFKLSTAGKLPMISYNTLLDVYILGTMLFLVGVTFEIAVLSLWKNDKHLSTLLDYYSVVAIVFILLFYHIGYWVMFIKVTSKRRKEINAMLRKHKANLSTPINSQRKRFLSCMKDHSSLEFIKEFFDERLPYIGMEGQDETSDLLTPRITIIKP